MLGFTPRDIKSLHEEFLRDLQEVCTQEANLLEDEKNIIRLLKKYESKFFEKPIFQNAKWKRVLEPTDSAGITHDVLFKGKNAYAKIVTYFYTLIIRLRQNIRKQEEFFTEKWTVLGREYDKEKEEIERMPLFKDVLKRTDTKALYTVKKIYRLLHETYRNLNMLNNYFFNETLRAEPESPNIIGFSTTEPLREFPSKMHEVLKQIYDYVDFKNETFQKLKRMVSYELELEEQIIRYREKEYPLRVNHITNR
ncbi:MAG: hypothetical protein Q8R04_07415 [Nanoarchaeota archaeon]|nr:hypothetical protein [Nanoarchaeota archaeon]